MPSEDAELLNEIAFRIALDQAQTEEQREMLAASQSIILEFLQRRMDKERCVVKLLLVDGKPPPVVTSRRSPQPAA